MLTHNEVAIPVSDNHVHLWRVRGIDDLLYPTKIAAEVAARARFPDESEDKRYSRISYELFCGAYL